MLVPETPVPLNLSLEMERKLMGGETIYGEWYRLCYDLIPIIRWTPVQKHGTKIIHCGAIVCKQTFILDNTKCPTINPAA